MIYNPYDSCRFCCFMITQKNEHNRVARSASHGTFPYSYYNYYNDGSYFSEKEQGIISPYLNDNEIFSSNFDDSPRINFKRMGEEIDRQFGKIKWYLTF